MSDLTLDFEPGMCALAAQEQKASSPGGRRFWQAQQLALRSVADLTAKVERQETLRGADFAAMAKRHSELAQALNDWFRDGTLTPAEYARHADTFKILAISVNEMSNWGIALRNKQLV